MKTKTRVILVVLGIVFLFVGCAGYGKLRYARPSAYAVTTQELLDQWQDYEIYLSGRRDDPSAILFGAKNLNQRLVVDERWSRVENEQMLLRAVHAIENQPSFGGYYARLWVVLGPDDHFYGYMLTAWDRALLKMLDEKTLYVYDMPLPRYRVKERSRGL